MINGTLLTVAEAAEYRPQAKAATKCCTRGLNLDATSTRFSQYYDYHSTHLDKYYFKHSMVERNAGLRRPSGQAGEYEYADEDSDLAIRCCRIFYKSCAKFGVSTRNPYHFWQDMKVLVDENRTSRVQQAALFLLGCEENRFLFDSSYTTQLPEIFITRASIQQFKENIPFLIAHPEYYHILKQPLDSLGLPMTEENCVRICKVMEEQILELQLYLPNKYRFLHNYGEMCAHYNDVFWERAQSAHHVADQYDTEEMPPPNDESPHMKEIVEITKNCLEWYVNSQTRLGGSLITKSKEESDMLQNSFDSPQDGDYHRDFNRLITDVTDHGYHPFLDLCLYTLISQHRSALTIGIFQNWTLQWDFANDEPNTEAKSSDDTVRKRYRWNLLLFQKLHHECNKLGLCNESKYFFEKTTPYFDEAYPDIALLDEPAKPKEDKSAKPKVDKPEKPDVLQQYLLKGSRGEHKVFPQLHQLVSDVEYSITLSPFDVMRHRLWNVTYQDLEQFRRSSKKRAPSVDPSSAGKKRMGKSTNIQTMIANAVKKLQAQESYFDRYYNLVFCHPSGFGTGLPTYDWAYEVATLIDELLAKNSFAPLKKIADTDKKNAELIELSIHQYFLDHFKGDTLKIIQKLGKFLLYMPRSCVED